MRVTEETEKGNDTKSSGYCRGKGGADDFGCRGCVDVVCACAIVPETRPPFFGDVRGSQVGILPGQTVGQSEVRDVTPEQVGR